MAEVYVDEDNPDGIVRWEKWDNRQSWDVYLAWHVANGLPEITEPITASPARVVHLSNTNSLKTRRPSIAMVPGCFRTVRTLATR